VRGSGASIDRNPSPELLRNSTSPDGRGGTELAAPFELKSTESYRHPRWGSGAFDNAHCALRSIGVTIASVDLSSKGAASSVPPLPSGEVELRSNSGEGLRSIEAPEPLTRRSAPTSPDGRGETGQTASAIVARLAVMGTLPT